MYKQDQINNNSNNVLHTLPPIEYINLEIIKTFKIASD